MKDNYTLTKRETNILVRNIAISERDKKLTDLPREVFEDAIETYRCNIRNNQTRIRATLNSLNAIIEDLGYVVFVKTYNSIQNKKNERKNIFLDCSNN